MNWLRDKRLPWGIPAVDVLVFLVALGAFSRILTRVGPGEATDGSSAIRTAVAVLLALFIAVAARTAGITGLAARRVWNVAFTVLFLAVINFHLLNSVLHLARDRQSTEKRELAARPPFSLGGLLRYPAAFEKYFNDRFSLRSKLIRFNHLLKVELFGVSPVPQQVVLGSDDWLFYAAEGELDNYMCKRPFTDEALNQISDGLRERRRWLEERGIRHYILIVPNKSTVYREHMPGFIRHCDTSRLDQLVERLRPEYSFRLIDIREDLAREKKKDLVFYKTDTHWNQFGAFWGYARLMEAIQRDFPGLKILRYGDIEATRVKSYSGDLAKMLSLDNAIHEDVTTFAPKRAEALERLNPPAISGVLMPTIVYEKESSTEPRVVMFMDSFFPYMRSFFTESFSRGVYVWSLSFRKEVVEQERPDIVIEEVIERNIDLRFVNVRKPAAPR